MQQSTTPDGMSPIFRAIDKRSLFYGFFIQNKENGRTEHVPAVALSRAVNARVVYVLIALQL